MSTENPRVVHCKQSKYDVLIDRTTRWGNPFVIGRDGNRLEVIAKYDRWLDAQPELLALLPTLRGKILGCHCSPDPCHGSVLARRVDDLPDDRPRCCTCGPGDHHSYQCEWGFCNGERCPNGAADRARDKIPPASCCTSPINDRLAARPWGAEWQRVLYELEKAGLPILDCDADVAYLDGYVAYRERPPAELVAALGKTWRTEPAGEGFEAWCDGSATTKDKPAGVGVVLTEFRWEEPRLTLRESSIEVAEHVGNGTNQYAELMAVWRALTLVPNLAAPLVINTDSRYAIGCVTDLTWKIRSHGELVARIRLDLSKRGDKVRFKHVAGHTGVDGNERADRLAKQGRLSGGGGAR